MNSDVCECGFGDWEENIRALQLDVGCSDWSMWSLVCILDGVWPTAINSSIALFLLVSFSISALST